MGIIIREMEAYEAGAIQSLGLETFLRSLEGFYVSRPKTAKVAVLNGKIVGSLIYTTDICGGKKIGFVDFFFVNPAHAGRGIGRELCKEGIAYLWSEGYDYLGAVVRDDNVGSWAAFEKNGFTNAGLLKIARAVGFTGFLKMYFKHGYFLSSACDLHFAPRPDSGAELSSFKKRTGFGQVALNLFGNFLLLLIGSMIGMGILRGTYSFADFFAPDSPVAIIAALLMVFGGTFLLSYIGTLFSGRKWRFRTPTGGFILNFLISLVGFYFPIGGSFYPQQYENTSKFRRDMGLSALWSWLYIMVLLTVAVIFAGRLTFISTGTWAFISELTSLLLIFRCLPFPHANFGTSRIFAWNKIVYGVMLLGSVYLVFFL